MNLFCNVFDLPYLCIIYPIIIPMRKFTLSYYLTIVLLLGVALQPTCAKRPRQERPKVGLVLGGGGAKGAAEVGALKYIEQAGIPIDFIAGTSIGSIVGGLYACGYRSEQLDSMFRSQEWSTLLTDRNLDFSNKPIKKKDGTTYFFGYPIYHKTNKMKSAIGLVQGEKILQLLDSMTNRPDSISFDSLPIPFRCVATDYINRRKVVLKSGHLAKSMRASMAIPGAYKPVEIDGVELLDGGLVDNLPVDVVLDMGADIVIAIDLTQNKHEGEKEWKRQRRGTKYEESESLWGQLMRWVKQRPDLSQYEENLKYIDVYINPDLKGFSAASFSTKKVAEMIKRGEEAGAKALKKLKEIKKKVE